MECLLKRVDLIHYILIFLTLVSFMTCYHILGSYFQRSHLCHWPYFGFKFLSGRPNSLCSSYIISLIGIDCMTTLYSLNIKHMFTIIFHKFLNLLFPFRVWPPFPRKLLYNHILYLDPLSRVLQWVNCISMMAILSNTSKSSNSYTGSFVFVQVFWATGNDS